MTAVVMSHTSTRLIDKETGSRTRPMKVLVLGCSRTGTMSIYTALQKLSYKPYHLAEAAKDPPRLFPLWEEALRAKYLGIGKQWGRVEFDKILGDFDGVSDKPTIQFAEELITAYPEAKIVLTNRDPDEWLASMSRTALTCVSWPSWKWVASWDPELAGPWYSIAQLMLGTWIGRPDYDPLKYLDAEYQALTRDAFVKHYEEVRRLAKEKGVELLEFKSEDGWKPLCDFLGQNVPESEYLHINETNDFIKFHRIMWWMAFGKMIAKTVGPVVVAVGVFYAWRVWVSV